MRTCRTCGKEKELNDFGMRVSKYGVISYSRTCKECSYNRKLEKAKKQDQERIDEEEKKKFFRLIEILKENDNVFMMKEYPIEKIEEACGFKVKVKSSFEGGYIVEKIK